LADAPTFEKRYRLRHRHAFAGLLPRYSEGTLWRSKTWLWWTWDFLPDNTGDQLREHVRWFDRAAERLRAGPPTIRQQDRGGL
jgi:hypothetical protein